MEISGGCAFVARGRVHIDADPQALGMDFLEVRAAERLEGPEEIGAGFGGALD